MPEAPSLLRPLSCLLVDELDVHSQNTNKSRTASSSNRNGSSVSTHPSRARCYSNSSLSHAGGETSNTSNSEDSMKHTLAQRIHAQIRTSDAISRDPLYAKKGVDREARPPPDSRFSVPASSHGELNTASGSRSREPSFDSMRSKHIG